MTLLAVDIGTTHCKAGLFAANGRALKIESRPMGAHQTPEGWAYYDPHEVWNTVVDIIKGVMPFQEDPIAAVGITSMAETGLLVNRHSGALHSYFIPWYETAAQPYADQVQQNSDPLECYLKFGLQMNFKCGLAKLLWLLDRDPALLKDALWLSAADYIAYRLTGRFGTDYSLAGRTFAFQVYQKEWDVDWLHSWGLLPDLFPPVRLSGSPVGWVQTGEILPAGIPVAVCGHDHVCGALAAGAIQPGVVFDSMGTAETIIGALQERPLTAEDYKIGLLYGSHVVKGLGYWMGSVSASGGSVEWLRSIFGANPISYQDLDSLMEKASPRPTEILYYSYLLGSSSPHTNPYMRGAFVGLSASDSQATMFKAVLEGIAYEVEYIRRAGEQMLGQPISSLVTAGGGTRNRRWLQIKADISGCRIEASSEPEASLLGAALSVGIGIGEYRNAADARAAMEPNPLEVYLPDPEKHKIYRNLYEQGYLALHIPLKRYYENLPPCSPAMPLTSSGGFNPIGELR